MEINIESKVISSTELPCHLSKPVILKFYNFPEKFIKLFIRVYKIEELDFINL